MRKGKHGTWWVLKRDGEPFWWTGELVEHPIEGELVIMPVLAMELHLAQQFRSRDYAELAHSLFGLPPTIVPEEREFPPMEREPA